MINIACINRAYPIHIAVLCSYCFQEKIRVAKPIYEYHYPPPQQAHTLSYYMTHTLSKLLQRRKHTRTISNTNLNGWS